jgi:hypothetical protein
MRSFLLISLILAAGCSDSSKPTATTPTTPKLDLTAGPVGPAVRILFLGNSLTAGNDVPGLVKAMAEAGGVPVFVHALTPGGVGMEDHWNNPQTREMVGWGRWTHVVLQQGPSSRPESQADLKKWAEIWGREIRVQGATPVFYMVWPVKSEPQMFPEVAKSYRAGAEAAKGTVAATGEAWQELLRLDPTAELYSDDLHATPLGSYLAALVLTHRLTGVKPEKVPGKLTLESGAVVEVPAEKLEAVRRAAEKAIEGK